MLQFVFVEGMARLLLLVGGLLKRIGFIFDNSSLVFVSVFLSLPNSLQHHHCCAIAPAGNMETLCLVPGSHHKFHR